MSSSLPFLFPHQQDTVDTFFRERLNKCLLCHPMGSGKTVTVIRIVERLIVDGHVERVTIVAPLKTRDHWQGHLSLSKAMGTVYVNVASYSTGLNREYDRLKTDKLARDKTVLIVDEAHNFHLERFRPSSKKNDRKGSNDDGWKAYRNASRACMLVRVSRQVPYVILVTGTPVLNTISDMRVPYLVLTEQALTRKAHDQAFTVFKTPFPLMIRSSSSSPTLSQEDAKTY